jgi:hypothetical protein
MTQTRAHERFVMAMAAEIQSGGRSFTATTKDISQAGCCVVSPYPLAEDTTIHCSLYIVLDGVEEAELGALETLCSVQWTADTEEQGSDTRYVAGLQFVDMGQAQCDWLEGVLAQIKAQG